METIINHPIRKALNLSVHEYCVLDEIYVLCHNKKYGGWCVASKKYIGKILDLSDRTVHTHINTLLAKGYIIKDDKTGWLQTKDEFNEIKANKKDWLIAFDGKESQFVSGQVRLQNNPEKISDTMKKFQCEAEKISDTMKKFQSDPEKISGGVLKKFQSDPEKISDNTYKSLSSYSYENSGKDEKMENRGGGINRQLIFKRFPNLKEGRLQEVLLEIEAWLESNNLPPKITTNRVINWLKKEHSFRQVDKKENDIIKKLEKLCSLD
jgi:hypothetical protein